MNPLLHRRLLVICIAALALRSPGALANSVYIGGGSGQALQAAMNAASPGDTIVVGPGTYSVVRSLWVLKPLHILSEKGPQTTIIANVCDCYRPDDWGYGSSGFHIYYTMAGDFTIAGFTIRDHSEYGFDVSSGYGISACASGTIRDNVFQRNQKAIGALCGVTVLRIENNIIYRSNRGITTEYAASIEVHHNTMANNYEQIVIGYSRPGPSSVAIAHNIIASGHWGIKADSSAALSISCNDVWNNSAGNYLGYVSDRTGVDGNISMDPLFCNGHYLHLGSPCLGANVPEICDGEHMGCFPIPCEVGTERTPWGKIKNLFYR